jgi:hypothetical protein
MIPKRYSKDAVINGIKHPERIVDEIKYNYERMKFYSKYRNAEETNPLKYDYDNLITLDACRYDIFKKYSMFDAVVEYKISKASNSIEFCEYFINGNTYFDTILITANPYSAEAGVGSFSHVYNPSFDKPDYWSEYFDPEVVYDLALKSYKKFRNKKMIIHFMQPHAPYYGDNAADLRQDLREDGYEFFTWSEDITSCDDDEYMIANLLTAAQSNLITKEELRRVYIENLEIVLQYVNDLIERINGKTIITADHGELLQYRLGHGPNMDVEGLKKVPWQELDYDCRRNVSEDYPSQTYSHSQSDVNEQLTALGYK